MADVARRDAKIQFYGTKDADAAADARPLRVEGHVTEKARERPTAADAAAIRNLPLAEPSFTPANSAQGTWAPERREGHEPFPDERTTRAPAAQEPSMTTPTPAGPQAPALTIEEAAFILDGVRGQDPALIRALIERDFDIAPFAGAKKDKLTPAQRERIKTLDFADLLRLGDELGAEDAEFQKRWAVLNTPNGRVWLKKNLARLQAVL